MDELFSYSLTDLLMFTPQTYARLFERYNQMLWPAHLPVAALSLWLIYVTRQPTPAQSRLISLLLSCSWAAIAWLFFLKHYATINLAAPWFAAGFAVQAILLLIVEVKNEGLHYHWSGSTQGWLGISLLFFALVGVPLVNLLTGHTWQGIELFGLTPDPTALGTLGLLLMTQNNLRWLLVPLPLLWCVITLLTHLALVMKG